MGRQIERREKRRQVAKPKTNFGVGGRSGVQGIRWSNVQASEIGPERAPVDAESKWQAPDQRQMALGEQQSIEIVAGGDHGHAISREDAIAHCIEGAALKG